MGTQPGEVGVGLGPAAGELDAYVVAHDAVVEDDHPVGEHDRLVDVVGHQQDSRLVRLAELAQQHMHADAGQRVERTERLVGEQQLRIADQRARQRDPLLLAT